MLPALSDAIYNLGAAVAGNSGSFKLPLYNAKIGMAAAGLIR